MIEIAIALALECHRGQKDKAGKPYILHPLRLMLKFRDEAQQVTAVLHDVVEDGDITLDELRARGISDEVVEAVDCLSRRKGEDYMAFIARINGNPLARAVKIADLKDNMDVTRLQQLTPRDLERIAKYHRALAILQGK